MIFACLKPHLSLDLKNNRLDAQTLEWTNVFTVLI